MIAEILSSFEPVAFSRTRYAASAPVKGRAAAPVGTVAAGSGVFVPASGRELLRLPEGLRSREVIRVFTETALQSGTETTIADDITYDGGVWQVQNVKDYAGHGGFYDALAVRKPSVTGVAPQSLGTLSQDAEGTVA